MAVVTLQYNSTTYRVYCDQVTFGGNKSIDTTPNANIGGPVEGQTLAYENLKINLQGVRLTNLTSGSYPNPLTWATLISMYKHSYSGPSGTGLNGQIKLTVTAGTTSTSGHYSGSTTVTGLAGTAPIPVLLKSFSFPFDVRDSKDGYLPVGSMSFEETL